MSAVTRLKLLQGAGDPDDVLPLRIDVVKAAVEWYDAHTIPDVADAEDKLEVAVRKYKAALRRRKRLQA